MASNKVNISVVICSYNRAAYIVQALDSLFHQTLQKEAFEVLVVDNNSIDNTQELVEHFIREHPAFNCVYVTESRQGASYARNTGAALAKGRLLCFMDDDAIAELHFQRINSELNDRPTLSGFAPKNIKDSQYH